mmetsp:Transcript_12572/g.33319  ORF Transcript_12572/g.33319 Transcript_12572/m.33319 type:complete len:241 (-) Transcript_12572:1100-1822(-)
MGSVQRHAQLFFSRRPTSSRAAGIPSESPRMSAPSPAVSAWSSKPRSEPYRPSHPRRCSRSSSRNLLDTSDRMPSGIDVRIDAPRVGALGSLSETSSATIRYSARVTPAQTLASTISSSGTNPSVYAASTAIARSIGRVTCRNISSVGSRSSATSRAAGGDAGARSANGDSRPCGSVASYCCSSETERCMSARAAPREESRGVSSQQMSTSMAACSGIVGTEAAPRVADHAAAENSTSAG